MKRIVLMGKRATQQWWKAGQEARMLEVTARTYPLDYHSKQKQPREREEKSAVLQAEVEVGCSLFV